MTPSTFWNVTSQYLMILCHVEHEMSAYLRVAYRDSSRPRYGLPVELSGTSAPLGILIWIFPFRSAKPTHDRTLQANLTDAIIRPATA